jgi:hypothetical protein
VKVTLKGRRTTSSNIAISAESIVTRSAGMASM